MRTHLSIALLLISCLPLTATANDEAGIWNVIEKAYVQGVWAQRDPDLVRQGFAPTFVMQVHRQGELSHRTLDEWLERMKLDRVPNKKAIRAEVDILDRTSSAAVAKVELFVDSKHAYTDYFGLYQTDAGWKIVSKHYFAHP